ncbi:Aste57867_7901 [Aphanomyces stellatus]|uniref:Aste57867_7901 protein n=1 Tax=Aphanomyces stellatus TaxID=120398 RepID=A0A485KIX4_9STRA|nr:hypothetical protein As57867_007871 [Aphanomyces stellatus]VFT84794.1 Aste57867_7901 [Aphanomyces stellatus]
MKRRDSNTLDRSSFDDTAMMPMAEDVPVPGRSTGKRLALIAGAVLLVAGGVTAAVVLSKKSTSTDSNSKSGTDTSNKTPSPGSDGDTSGSLSPSSPTQAPGPTPAPTPAWSDPETDPVLMTMLAIGDWGSTTGRNDDGTNPGSCCVIYTSGSNKGQIDTSKPRYKIDFRAQESVGKLLGMSAAQLNPVRVLGHGDNIYWNGVGADDVKYRMTETFEKMYSAPSLANVPWLNVAGNHDIGGSAYICGDSDTTFRKCTSTAEMLTYLDKKFTLQSTYVSPNANNCHLWYRWKMPDHYYVERVTKGGITVDIFNLDTNEATTHGAQQVCCQCFGQGGTASQCDNINAGDPMCAGGDTGMFKACMDKIQGWADQSYKNALRDLAASTADFKIINTHYSPQYHMDAPRIKKWFDLTKTGGVHAWFNGHTHGFNHDITDWFTHFFQNGAGGGIVSQSSGSVTAEVGGIKSQWVAAGQPYGFMELSFSKEWLKVQFVSFDKTWGFNGFKAGDVTPGGIARGHCWYIHKSLGSKGVKCKSSDEGVVGLPT